MFSARNSEKVSILSNSQTRPQTALTSPQRQQHIETMPQEDFSEHCRDIQYKQSTTSLTPRSLLKVQERKRQDNGTNKPIISSRSENTSCNLRVTKEQAEIDPPEDYFEKEVQINQNEYDQFKKNFHKIVFDAFGNYIYTKPNTLDQEQKLQVNSALNSYKYTSSNLKRKLQMKTQSFQPKKIIDNLVKSTSEISKMNPRRKAILDIKQKSENSLYQMISNLAKDKMLNESKQLLTQTTQEMLVFVDKFIRENQELTDQVEACKTKIFELQGANESLNFKNLQLQKELHFSREKLDELKRSTVEIEKFLPQFHIMTQRFENFQAEKFIDKFDYFQNQNLELTKKVGELEMDIIQLDKKINQLTTQLEQKSQNRSNTFNQEIISQHSQYDNINPELEQYKEQYFILFKKILQIYCEWTGKDKALLPNNFDGGPRANLVAPIEMLQNMEKMISISSNEKLQGYLRKIIVSANQLQRKYLTENVNQQFDPDKIYDRIVKLVDNLKAQIVTLQHQVQTFKTTSNQQILTQRSKSYLHEK